MKICDHFRKKLYSDNCNELADTVWNALRKKVSLKGAYLANSYLEDINFQGADLREANFYNTSHREANFVGANLKHANFDCGVLFEANFSRANLTGANLSFTNIEGANFTGANLTDTCLDPQAKLPSLDLGGDEKAFAANAKATENDPEFLYGWRTASSRFCKTKGRFISYEPGCEYVAPWFSVSKADCHPGLYLAPSVKWLEKKGYQGPYIMVKALKTETIKAGEKYRCKRFWVL